ncbi:MAG: 50S ribosomal protein L39e [Candidatus Micrarchaeaceae archaeon]
MSKKTLKRKMRLGKKHKQNRRMPVLAVVKTHRRLQHNKFQRDWRRRKLRIKD